MPFIEELSREDFADIVDGEENFDTVSGSLASGKPMKGPVVYQTLPFMHPNAATRAKGFKDVFTKYPDIEIIELTGISPEDHYNAFDGAIKAHPDMIGAWGLYSSATIGMLNAKKANGKDDLLLVLA